MEPPVAATQATITQLETLISTHAEICGRLYEALAQGTMTDEIQSDADKIMNQAHDLAIEMNQTCLNSEFPVIQKAFEAFHAHCDAWDITDNKGKNPVNEILDSLRGILHMLI